MHIKLYYLSYVIYWLIFYNEGFKKRVNMNNFNLLYSETFDSGYPGLLLKRY